MSDTLGLFGVGLGRGIETMSGVDTEVSGSLGESDALGAYWVCCET